MKKVDSAGVEMSRPRPTSNGNVLIFMPASGFPTRVPGAFTVARYRPGLCCPGVVVAAPKEPLMLFDARSIVYDDGNFELLWHPRRNLHQIDPELARWFLANPDIFASPCDGGLVLKAAGG